MEMKKPPKKKAIVDGNYKLNNNTSIEQRVENTQSRENVNVGFYVFLSAELLVVGSPLAIFNRRILNISLLYYFPHLAIKFIQIKCCPVHWMIASVFLFKNEISSFVKNYRVLIFDSTFILSDDSSGCKRGWRTSIACYEDKELTFFSQSLAWQSHV